jgi:predicted ester cyclase
MTPSVQASVRGGRGKEIAMTIEDNKRIVRRFFDEVLTGKKIEVLDELAAPDFDEQSPLPGQGTGLEGLKDRARMLTTGIDSHFTLDDVVAEGDMVVVGWTNQGTHVGEFLGIPATGKRFTNQGVGFYRVRDGRMVGHRHVLDIYPFLQDVGVIPAQEGAEG